MNNVNSQLSPTVARRSRGARKWKVIGAAVGAALLWVGVSAAQQVEPSPSTQPADDNGAAPKASLVSEGLGQDGSISLMLDKSTVLTTAEPYKRVSVSQPEVADVNLVGPASILLTAKKPGTTQLIIWNDDNRSQVIDVNVGFDVEALRRQLKEMFPGTDINVTVANGTIALRGRVPNVQAAEQAVEIASPYAPKVLNFLEISGGQQVMLQVRFAEISRAASSELGFNTFATDGTAAFGSQNSFGGNPIGGLATGDRDTIINPAVTVFGAGRIGSTVFEAYVTALRRNNLLRVLAEPNLIAISGQEASFLAGGEFPIPVPQDGGDSTAITIEYKPFGVQLNFVPTVLGDGKIRLRVSPEVSDLDFTRSVSFGGFVIPSLTKRTVDTTIELNEGQTFAVAGLLSNRVIANKNVTPLLGDLPILGTLFRSVRYERSETELVVLVTPRLVSPLNPGQLTELPGEHWRDPNEADLFINRDLGGPLPPRGGFTDGEGTGGDASAGALTDEVGDVESDAPEAGEPAEGDVPGETETRDENPAAAGQPPSRFRGQYGFTPAQ